MTPLFKKLNLSTHDRIVVLNAPSSFEPELTALEGITVQRSLGRSKVGFMLAFVQTLAEIETLAGKLTQAEGDAIVWLAYPKQTSRTYTCEFNRDTGWAALGEKGFEPVRQVAIDADWSALRFRRVEFIRTLTRDPSRTLSNEGKARTKKPKEPS